MPVAAEPSAPSHWRSRAFGLELEGSFPAPGLPALDGPYRARPTRLELCPADAIDAAWPDDGATRLLEEWIGGRTPARTIDHHEAAGYRLFARHFGLALIAPDGERVLCAPPGVAPWRWQRFLVGRVLPWAAILRGLEVFHASAVAIDGRAVAFVGPSGAGKTSLAIRLVLGGAAFMTDDVLALDKGPDGALRAHPGSSVASLRAAERSAMPAGERRRLGTLLGHSDKTYLALTRASVALPLAAVYFLTRSEEPGADAIEPMPAPDPRVLLASTFVASVQTPRRLGNLLDVCSEVARTASAFRVRVQPGVEAAALADELDSHARSIIADAP
jgi:hypothetical protein